MSNSIILTKIATAKYLTSQPILSLRKVVKDFGLTTAIKASTKMPKEGLVNALVSYVKFENDTLTHIVTVEAVAPVVEAAIPVAPKRTITKAKAVEQLPSGLIAAPYPEPAPVCPRVEDPELDVVPVFPPPFLTADAWKADSLYSLPLSKLKELAKQRKDAIPNPSKLSKEEALTALLPLIDMVGGEVRVMDGTQVSTPTSSAPTSPVNAASNPFTYGETIRRLAEAERALPSDVRAAKADAFKKKAVSFRVSDGSYPLLEDNPIPSPPSDENCPFNTGKAGCEFVQLLGFAPVYPLVRHDHFASLTDEYLNWLIAEVIVCDYTYRCIPSIYERKNYLEFIHYKGQLDEEMLRRLNPGMKMKGMESIEDFRAEREKEEKKEEKRLKKLLEEEEEILAKEIEAARIKRVEEYEKEMEKIMEDRQKRRAAWEEARKKGEKVVVSFLSEEEEEEIQKAPINGGEKDIVDFEVKFTGFRRLSGFDSEEEDN